MLMCCAQHSLHSRNLQCVEISVSHDGVVTILRCGFGPGVMRRYLGSSFSGDTAIAAPAAANS